MTMTHRILTIVLKHCMQQLISFLSKGKTYGKQLKYAEYGSFRTYEGFYTKLMEINWIILPSNPVASRQPPTTPKIRESLSHNLPQPFRTSMEPPKPIN